MQTTGMPCPNNRDYRNKVKLIFGLGNPGPRYARTRHNIGWRSVSLLATRHTISLSSTGCGCTYGTGTIADIPVVLACPMVFMNNSGEAVISLMHHYHASPHDIIVIHDDLDITLGLLKIKTRGGSAGHRGIISIIEHLQTNVFTRIRIGIGKPPRGVDPATYVLEKFTDHEQKMLDGVLHASTVCCETILTQGVAQAMHVFHSQSIPLGEQS